MAQPCPDDSQTRSAPGTIALPLFDADHRPGRQYTCRYRCGNACAHNPPNPSENEYFGTILRRAISRRGALRAGAVVTIAVGASGALAGTAAAAPGGPTASGDLPRGLDYETVPVNNNDAITVPPGYRSNIVIRWGDPIVPGAPEFDFDNQTPEAAAQQFGYNNDFCGLVPLTGRGERYIMFNNHEYSIEPLMFRGYDEENPTETQYRIGLESHGLSVHVVERDKKSGEMRSVADEQYNRRHTGSTEFRLVGPAAGSDLLKTSADDTGTTVLGTLNNCAGGVTPWGTFLSGEENFNQYFANAAAAADPVVVERAARYGITEDASDRKWERFDKRFDMAQEPNEPNRFGWIVEVDPFDPKATPVKRTALGRFKHEGATIGLTEDGRAVAYMGDDEVFDYVYKFVSDEKMMKGESRRAREHNASLLDNGTLYVATFTGNSPDEIDGTGTVPADGDFDGTGAWIKLAAGNDSFVEGMTAEEVYVFTRFAGDAVGATKMDRPEDVEPNPRTGKVYIALTNNTRRGVDDGAPADEANPRNANRFGHVIEFTEDGDDGAATAFGWSILIVAGDPDDPSTFFSGFDKSEVSPITSPDNLAFDNHGNLWISTDSGRNLKLPELPLGINDGLYGVSLEGATRGRTALFASMPNGAEACGPVITDEFVLISPQHPGDLTGAGIETPQSTFPDGPGTQPRPSVVSIWNAGTKGRPGRIGQ